MIARFPSRKQLLPLFLLLLQKTEHNGDKKKCIRLKSYVTEIFNGFFRERRRPGIDLLMSLSSLQDLYNYIFLTHLFFFCDVESLVRI